VDFILQCILSELAFTLQFAALHKCSFMGNSDSPWLPSAILDLIDTVLKHFILVFSKEPNKWFSPVPMNSSRISDVVLHLRETFLVEIDQFVERTFCNIKRTQTWHEIVTNEETEEHKVINNALQIKPDLHFAG
jgi:hypothetical protein